jgi:hypothetical protein
MKVDHDGVIELPVESVTLILVKSVEPELPFG